MKILLLSTLVTVVFGLDFGLDLHGTNQGQIRSLRRNSSIHVFSGPLFSSQEEIVSSTPQGTLLSTLVTAVFGHDFGLDLHGTNQGQIRSLRRDSSIHVFSGPLFSSQEEIVSSSQGITSDHSMRLMK